MAPRRRSFDLPPELVDHLIDFLWHDVLALEACALVSRTWRPTAQLHRFGTVSIKTPGELERLCKVLDDNDRLPTYVRHVKLGAEQLAKAGWVIQAIQSLGARILHTQHFVLVLLGSAVQELGPDSVFALCKHFCSVRKLSLVGVRLYPSDFAAIVTSFPLLTHLDVAMLQFRSGAVGERRETDRPSLPLTTLAFSYPMLRISFLPILEAYYTLDKVDTVSIYESSQPYEKAYLATFLASCGLALKRLRITGTKDRRLDLDLSHVTNLEHLVLDGIGLRWTVNEPATLTFPISVIALLPLNLRLQELSPLVDYSRKNTIFSTGSKDLRELDWPAIADALDPAIAPIGRCLRRVNIGLFAVLRRGFETETDRVILEQEGVQLEKSIKMHLAHLDKRGILRVCRSVSWDVDNNEVLWELRDSIF